MELYNYTCKLFFEALAFVTDVTYDKRVNKVSTYGRRIMAIRAQLGQRYRVTSVSFPDYGIGTVVKINSDLSGIMQNEEKGKFYFQHFDISMLAGSFEEVADESVRGILGEIRMLEANGMIPVGAISCFSDLHDYIDANVLVLKHVPREAGDWAASETQSKLDNTVMNCVSLWLSLGSIVMS